MSCCCCSSCHCSLSSTAGVSQPMPGETKGKRTGCRAKQTLHDSRAIQLQCFCKTFLVTAASYILLWQRILGTSSPAPIALHAGRCDKAAYLLVENVNKQEMSGYEFSFLHIHVFFIPLAGAMLTSAAAGKRHMGELVFWPNSTASFMLRVTFSTPLSQLLH